MAAVCAAITGILVLLVWARPDLWMVEHVVFDGQTRASGAELRHLADIRNGTLVVAMDLEAAAEATERHPWVRAATATFEWPDTVRIQVEEHRPIAVMHWAGDLLLVSDTGERFVPARGADLDHPHISGIEPGLAIVHPDLVPLALAGALNLLDELDTRGLVARDAVSEIAFSESLGFTVHAGNARLVFGHDDLFRQLDRLAVLVDGGLDPLGRTYVDLAPARVAIVRPLPVPTGG